LKKEQKQKTATRHNTSTIHLTPFLLFSPPSFDSIYIIITALEGFFFEKQQDNSFPDEQ